MADADEFETLRTRYGRVIELIAGKRKGKHQVWIDGRCVEVEHRYRKNFTSKKPRDLYIRLHRDKTLKEHTEVTSPMKHGTFDSPEKFFRRVGPNASDDCIGRLVYLCQNPARSSAHHNSQTPRQRDLKDMNEHETEVERVEQSAEETDGAEVSTEASPLDALSSTSGAECGAADGCADNGATLAQDASPFESASTTSLGEGSEGRRAEATDGAEVSTEASASSDALSSPSALSSSSDASCCAADGCAGEGATTEMDASPFESASTTSLGEGSERSDASVDDSDMDVGHDPIEDVSEFVPMVTDGAPEGGAKNSQVDDETGWFGSAEHPSGKMGHFKAVYVNDDTPALQNQRQLVLYRTRDDSLPPDLQAFSDICDSAGIYKASERHRWLTRKRKQGYHVLILRDGGEVRAGALFCMARATPRDKAVRDDADAVFLDLLILATKQEYRRQLGYGSRIMAALKAILKDKADAGQPQKILARVTNNAREFYITKQHFVCEEARVCKRSTRGSPQLEFEDSRKARNYITELNGWYNAHGMSHFNNATELPSMIWTSESAVGHGDCPACDASFSDQATEVDVLMDTDAAQGAARTSRLDCEKGWFGSEDRPTGIKSLFKPEYVDLDTPTLRLDRQDEQLALYRTSSESFLDDLRAFGEMCKSAGKYAADVDKWLQTNVKEAYRVLLLRVDGRLRAGALFCMASEARDGADAMLLDLMILAQEEGCEHRGLVMDALKRILLEKAGPDRPAHILVRVLVPVPSLHSSSSSSDNREVAKRVEQERRFYQEQEFGTDQRARMFVKNLRVWRKTRHLSNNPKCDTMIWSRNRLATVPIASDSGKQTRSTASKEESEVSFLIRWGVTAHNERSLRKLPDDLTLGNGGVCIKTSKVGGRLGRGLFAGRDLTKDNYIMYSGETISESEAKKRGNQDYIMRVRESDFLIDGSIFASAIRTEHDEKGEYRPLLDWASIAGPGCMANENKRSPNAKIEMRWLDKRQGYGSYRVIIPLRNIAEGDEILISYGSRTPMFPRVVLRMSGLSRTRAAETSSATQMQPRNCLEEYETLHTIGLVHIPKSRHGVDIPRFETNLMYYYKPIFNSHLNHGTNERQQARMASPKVVDREVLKFENDVSKELGERRNWLRTDSGTGANAYKKVEDGYKLRSLAGCKPQLVHADSCWEGGMVTEKPGDVPLVVLMARVDKTPFHFFPLGSPKEAEEQTVLLNAGDLVVFRGVSPRPCPFMPRRDRSPELRFYVRAPPCVPGDLAHAGAAFEDQNDRIHVYIDSPLHKREKNATFPSNRKLSDKAQLVTSTQANEASEEESRRKRQRTS